MLFFATLVKYLVFPILLIALIVSIPADSFAYGHLKYWNRSLIEDVVMNHRLVYCVKDNAIDKKIVADVLTTFISAIENDVLIPRPGEAPTLLKNIKINIKEDCSSRDSRVLRIIKSNLMNDIVFGWNIDDSNPAAYVTWINTIIIYSLENFDRSIVMHEIGHAFGLCDQYTTEAKEGRYPNCDKNHMTPYVFSESLMAALAGGEKTIHFDDIEGLISLFDRYTNIRRTGQWTSNHNGSNYSWLNRTYDHGKLVGDYHVYDKEQKFLGTYRYPTGDSGYQLQFYDPAGDFYQLNSDGSEDFLIQFCGPNHGSIAARFDRNEKVERLTGKVETGRQIIRDFKSSNIMMCADLVSHFPIPSDQSIVYNIGYHDETMTARYDSTNMNGEKFIDPARPTDWKDFFEAGSLIKQVRFFMNLSIFPIKSD